MAVSDTEVEDLVARLEPIGPVTARRMFGGVGLFLDGNMFAKVSGSGIIALKADDGNRDAFVAAGMTRSGKMPYYELTPEQLEDDELLLEAARLAAEAARH